MEYLKEFTDFTDLKKKINPDYFSKGHPYECPRCKGYGECNLKLNAYGFGKHLRTVCIQCNGWGYVGEKDKDCVHDFQELSQFHCNEKGIRHYGSCWHVYNCVKCDRVISFDSSD